VGGGKIAREYIAKARALGASEMFCDLIGIAATRLTGGVPIKDATLSDGLADGLLAG
jgi:uridylate kinase